MRLDYAFKVSFVYNVIILYVFANSSYLPSSFRPRPHNIMFFTIVFLEGQQKGKFTVPLKPIVSDPIYDKKSMSDLVITKLSHCNAFCNGGQEMILLCEKVIDIHVVHSCWMANWTDSFVIHHKLI